MKGSRRGRRSRPPSSSELTGPPPARPRGAKGVATSDTDPAFQTMLSFITTQVALDRLFGANADGVARLQQSIALYAAHCAQP